MKREEFLQILEKRQIDYVTLYGLQDERVVCLCNYCEQVKKGTGEETTSRAYETAINILNECFEEI